MKKLLRRTALVLGILLALVALRIVVGRLAGPMLLENARARFEAEVGPLRPELADATVAPEDNAGPLLLEAANALELSQADRDLLSAIGDDPAAASDPEVQQRLRLALERNLRPLARIDEAAERPDSLMHRRRDYFRGEGDLNVTVQLLAVAKLIRAAGRVAIAEGSDEAYLVAVERLATLARTLRQERILVTGMISGAVERHLYELVRLRVARPVPPGVVVRLDRVLGSIEESPRLREILAAECSVVGVVYPEIFDGDEVEESVWIRLIAPWDEDHFQAETLLSYVDLATLLDRPRAQWPEMPEVPRASVLRDLANPFSTPTSFRSILMPSLRDLVEKEQRLEAEHALARAALASLSPGAAPESERIAYTGEAIRRRELDDGALELSLPEAAELLRIEAEAYSNPSFAPRRVLERQAERMTWRVAPPIEATIPGDPVAI